MYILGVKNIEYKYHEDEVNILPFSPLSRLYYTTAMKFLIFFSALAVAEGHWHHHHHHHHHHHWKTEGRQATQDVCGSVVTGWEAQPTQSIRESDCSSFMTTTVTPPAASVQYLYLPTTVY